MAARRATVKWATSMVKVAKKWASGGKVCHLESSLHMRFTPRASGQIAYAFDSSLTLKVA